MFKRLKDILCNKDGNVGFIYIILIFLLICVNMLLGGMETNISIMTVNEVKDILQSAAPYAIRKGINKQAHKNEDLLYGYNTSVVRDTFINTVLDSLNDATFISRLVYNRTYLRNQLISNTKIETGKANWVNTWSELDNDEKKEVPFVTLTTVLPIEIKTNLVTSDVESIRESFNRTNTQGVIQEGDIRAEIELSENGLGAFIRFEMRVLLK